MLVRAIGFSESDNSHASTCALRARRLRVIPRYMRFMCDQYRLEDPVKNPASLVQYMFAGAAVHISVY